MKYPPTQDNAAVASLHGLEGRLVRLEMLASVNRMSQLEPYPHNYSTAIQGGLPGQRYHLTLNEWRHVASMVGAVL